MTRPPSRARRPIFIHALWRTGSTYVWSKFREHSRYRAYYEPLHEIFIDASVEKLEAAWSRQAAAIMRHPHLEASCFAEYEAFIRTGGSHFEKGLPYQRYCLEETESDEALRHYVADLLVFALVNGQTPLLQFNRSLLRVGWLTAHFNPVNILLLRRPFDVWKSFISFEHKYFPTVLCMIAGQNQHHPPLQGVMRRFEVPFFQGESWQSEYDFYHEYADRHLERLYPLFYEFYLLTSLYAVQYADCVIDLTETSERDSARRRVNEKLGRLGIDVSLGDCHLPTYTDLSAADRECLAYEPIGRQHLKESLPPKLWIPRDRWESHLDTIGGYFRGVWGEFLREAEAGPGVVSSIPSAEENHRRGLEHFERGQTQEASTFFRDALLEQPTPERWNDWASAQAVCGRLAWAELGYRRALNSGISGDRAAANLGLLFSQSGRYIDAMPLLRRALGSAGAQEAQVLNRMLSESQRRQQAELAQGSAAVALGAQASSPKLGPLPASQSSQPPEHAAACPESRPAAANLEQDVILKTFNVHGDPIGPALPGPPAPDAQAKEFAARPLAGLAVATDSEIQLQETGAGVAQAAGWFKPVVSKGGPSEGNSLIYFMHIPNTSGTGFRRFLIQVFGEAEVAPFTLWDDVLAYSGAGGNWKVWIGHFGGLLPIILPSWPRMVTILRDPVDRAISAINFAKRYTAHPFHHYAKGLSVLEFCNNPRSRASVDNIQARYLASLSFALMISRPGRWNVTFDEALFFMDQEYSLLDTAIGAMGQMDMVGIAEAHHQTLRLFARKFNVPAPAEPYYENRAGESQLKRAELSSEELECIQKLTQIDRVLYQHARLRFERDCRQANLDGALAGRLAESVPGRG